MYKDYLVLQWPFPTIVQAAGNGSSTEFVNHKGYNSFTVGNHDDTAVNMVNSVFRNPASPHGDRELPELAAKWHCRDDGGPDVQAAPAWPHRPLLVAPPCCRRQTRR